MVNPENIIKHNRNPEKKRLSSAKGGASRSVCKSLNKRKWCNGKCPIFPCFAEPLSYKQYRDEVTGKPMCGLKQFPSKIQRRTLDFYTRGEDGFNAQMVEILTELGNRVVIDGTVKEMRAYLKDITDVKKSMFGEKQKIDATVNAVTDEDFRNAYKELKKNQKK